MGRIIMLLSILIPTLLQRKKLFDSLKRSLKNQISNTAFSDKIEIISDSRITPTTGEKRNDLVKWAQGKYIWFVDDDDEIPEGSIQRLIDAMLHGPDVIGINGYMTTNGTNRVDWEIRLGHPYKAVEINGKEIYLRWPNHITPMLRSVAIQFKFPHKNQREDFEWSVAVKESGLLKTQIIVNEPVYHYKFLTNK